MEQTKSLTNESLTNKYPQKKVNELINKKYEIINDIIHHKNTVASLQFDKTMIELQIWDTCDHTWIRDSTALFDDIYKYKCSTCRLYNGRRLYVI